MSVATRIKLLLAGYGVVLALVLLIAAAAMFGLAYQVHSDPPTDTVTQEFDIEDYSVTSQTEATVDGPDPILYEPGERLVDKPAYFYNESPNLVLVSNLSTPAEADVDLDIRKTVHYEAARDDTVFWERDELVTQETKTVSDGEASVEAEINMLDVKETVERYQERAGTVGSIEAFIQLEITYESDLYEGVLAPDAEFRIGSQSFWLEDDLSDSTTESQTEAQTVELDPPMGQILGFIVLGVVLLGLCSAIIVTLYQGIDTEQLRTELARSEYTDWISRGEIPTSSEKQFVSIDSLEDLVDIAIDSNRRVLYDGEIDTYGVVEGDLVYYYSPTREDIDDWLDL